MTPISHYHHRLRIIIYIYIDLHFNIFDHIYTYIHNIYICIYIDMYIHAHTYAHIRYHPSRSLSLSPQPHQCARVPAFRQRFLRLQGHPLRTLSTQFVFRSFPSSLLPPSLLPPPFLPPCLPPFSLPPSFLSVVLLSVHPFVPPFLLTHTHTHRTFPLFSPRCPPTLS